MLHLLYMKKKIGVLFGGYSGEASVSQQSALNVYELVSNDLYDKYLIELDIDKRWWLHIDGKRIERSSRSEFSFRIDEESIIAIDEYVT